MMYKFKLFCGLLSTLLFLQSAFAGNPPQSFSLSDAVQFAHENSPALKVSKYDKIIADKKVMEVLANGLPQINAEGSFNDYIDIPTQIMPDFLTPAILGVNQAYFGLKPTKDWVNQGGLPVQFGQKYSANGSLNAGMLLFDGSFLLGLKASREYVNLAKYNVHQSEIQVETNVTKAYLMCLLMEARLQGIHSNLEALNKSLSDLKNYLKAGFAEKMDVEKLELNVSNLKIAQEQLNSALSVSYRLLKMHMGYAISDSVILKDNLKDLAIKVSQNNYTAIEGNYDNRIEYKTLNQVELLSNYDRKRYLWGYTPSVTVFGSMQRNSYGATMDYLGTKWYPTTIVGGKISLPIFDGLRKHYQTQQATLNLLKVKENKRNLESAISMERVNAFTNFNRTKEQSQIQKKNLDLAEQIHERARIKLKEGVGSTTELVLAESDLMTSQTNYLSNLYDLLVADLDLRNANGR